MNEKLPFKDVRVKQPLTDADFAAIRATVLAQVARRRRFPMARLALAATIVAAIALGAFVALHRPPQHLAARIAPPSHRPLPSITATPTTPAIAAAAPLAEAPATQPARRRRRHPVAPPQPMLAATGDEQAAITFQLQTSNPDIRIIWIERSSK
ncbi:MAG TPA: hypothetical protein VOA87_02570 [Thermoanaerobaculia bacterium]|nr:hypothetical protein [Thermoanaerobaculia bacterium]